MHERDATTSDVGLRNMVEDVVGYRMLLGLNVEYAGLPRKKKKST